MILRGLRVMESFLDWMRRSRTLRAPGSHPAERTPELACCSGAESEACRRHGFCNSLWRCGCSS